MLAALLLAGACYFCALAETEDGVYAPDSFSYTGGTGRVTISCERVKVAEGAAYADILFSSPNYVSVRIGEESFSPEAYEEGSLFRVPVPLNSAFSLFGTTTAMSTPHEIEYRLYIGLGGDEMAGMRLAGRMELAYAKGFCVDRFEGGYALIRVGEGEKYLMVPEGKDAPEGLDPSVTVLRLPLERVYLAATSAMSLFDAIGAMDAIAFSGTREDGWYVPSAVEAMKRGDIVFAGRYSNPDYEMLLREGCDLAVESMMILHTPQVRELLGMLGIPVFIDRSSSESHPLGRLEWIRLYGLLTGREAEADAVFAAQAALVEGRGSAPESGKTVAFFSVKPDGTVTVRGSEDYIARSIGLAGGRYVFDSIEGQETNASVSITMESFYLSALDADYLIYNSTIEAPVGSIGELVGINPLLGDLRAVKEGNVFCTGPSLYQSSGSIGTFIDDIGKMLSGEKEGLVFLYHIG